MGRALLGGSFGCIPFGGGASLVSPVIRYEFTARRAIASSPEEVMRWLSESELMARWILGAAQVNSEDGHVRLTVATRVARWHIASTYTGETVERTPERFVRRYIDDHDEVAIDRTITYELARMPTGCELTCSVITDVEGVAASVVRASRRQQQRSLRRSLRRLALLATGHEPTGWALYVDRRQTGQPL